MEQSGRSWYFQLYKTSPSSSGRRSNFRPRCSASARYVHSRVSAWQCAAGFVQNGDFVFMGTVWEFHPGDGKITVIWTCKSFSILGETFKFRLKIFFGKNLFLSYVWPNYHCSPSKSHSPTLNFDLLGWHKFCHHSKTIIFVDYFEFLIIFLWHKIEFLKKENKIFFDEVTSFRILFFDEKFNFWQKKKKNDILEKKTQFLTKIIILDPIFHFFYEFYLRIYLGISARRRKTGIQYWYRT